MDKSKGQLFSCPFLRYNEEDITKKVRILINN
jgi:hypothetical protein